MSVQLGLVRLLGQSQIIAVSVMSDLSREDYLSKIAEGNRRMKEISSYLESAPAQSPVGDRTPLFDDYLVDYGKTKDAVSKIEKRLKAGTPASEITADEKASLSLWEDSVDSMYVLYKNYLLVAPSQKDLDLMVQAAQRVHDDGAKLLQTFGSVLSEMESYDPREVDGAFGAVLSVLTLGTYWAWTTGTHIQQAIGRLAAAQMITQAWINEVQKDFFIPLGEKLGAADPTAYGAASNTFDSVVELNARFVDLKKWFSTLPLKVVMDAVGAFFKSAWDDLQAFIKFLRDLLEKMGKAAVVLADYLPLILAGLGGLAVIVFVQGMFQSKGSAKEGA